MGWLGGLAALLGAGASIYGGTQAAGQVQGISGMPVAGYDPAADPILGPLLAQASAGIGVAPDLNLTQAASPLNRLENDLINSLGRGATSSKALRNLNLAIQSAQNTISNALANGQTPDIAALEGQIRDAFITELRGTKANALYAAAKAATGVAGEGGQDASSIAQSMARAELGPDAKPEQVASRAQKYQAAVQAGLDQGLSGDQLARSIVDTVKPPGRAHGEALFNQALSSGGFDNLNDLLTQEVSYRQQASSQTSALGGAAADRFAARQAANASINRLLTDYPVYGAGDIQRESLAALAPYQAQELEKANALGYNPATNLALTRNQGIMDALQILSGRQQLANTALLGLRNELGQQTGEALATSGQAQSAFANSANLASQQALALANLGQRGEMYQGSALGGATTGAGLILSDYLGRLGSQRSSSSLTDPSNPQNPAYWGY